MFPVSTLQQALARLTHADLRAIATRLQLRQRAPHTKAFWVEAITTYWQDDQRRAAMIARLTPAAAGALERLVEAGTLPARPFFGEYGGVRRAANMRGARVKPWQEAHSPAEELYYAGLLYPADRRPIDRTGQVHLPEDLRRSLASQLAVRHLRRPELDAATLLHDAGQLLLFLHEHPALRLRYRRWIPAGHLSALNARMRRARGGGPWRSHKRAPWLAFLMFLVTTATLHRNGRLTPAGWAWLRMAPDRQLSALWQAWQTAPVDVRTAFAMPSAGFTLAGQEALLAHLAALEGVFTARQLASRFASQEPALVTYLNVTFASLGDLDALLRRMLETELSFLAIVARAAVSRRQVRHYAVTATGRQRLRGEQEAAAVTVSAPATVARREADESGWRIAVTDGPVTDAQAMLGAFGAYEGYARGERRDLPGCHVYRLDAATVASGVARGYGLPVLLAALRSLGIGTTPEEHSQLAAWAAGGQEVQLHLLPLLETSSPERLASLLQDTKIAALIGRIIRPTMATVRGDLARAIEAITAHGYPVAGQTARSVQAPKPSSEPGALWLAGMLYAAVGQLMPLPVPPPFAELAVLYAQLTPAEQAAAEAQLEGMQDDLARLVDHIAFTPPPSPSDPRQWLQPIQNAIGEAQLLTIRYISAGRNMAAQYTVEPYWIEDHHGAQYLRADVIGGAEALLFRLDRIEALAVDVPARGG